jgi:hypothetical protein
VKKRKTSEQGFFVIQKDVPMSDIQQKEFNIQWLYATLDANLSWMWGEYDHVKLLLQSLKPSVRIPSRKKLSGDILNEEDRKVQDQSIGILKKAHSVVLVVDTWKSIVRQSLLGVLLVSNNVQFLYDLKDISAQQHTGTFVYGILCELLAEIREQHDIQIDALITEGGSEMAKARKLIKRSHPGVVTLWCVSHLLNLLFGDVLKSNSGMIRVKGVIEECVSMVNWILNRQVALGLLREKQRELYNKQIALVQPGDTRWNSYIYMVKSVVKTSEALRSIVIEKRAVLLAGMRYTQLRKAEVIIQTIENPTFWTGIKDVKKLLDPLAVCVDISQSDDTTLATGSIMFMFLYENFRRNQVDYMLEKVDSRWLSIDVSVYIIAVFLHPHFHGRGFDLVKISLLSLTNMILEAYIGFFGEDDGYLTVRGQFARYMNFQAPFENQLMIEFKGDPIGYWSLCATDKNSSALATLAMMILSIHMPGAGIERAFSACGIIQTA